MSEVNTFIIDNNLRQIIIPDGMNILGVAGDIEVKCISFEMPRYYNGIDMSEFDIFVDYENAKGCRNYYKVVDTKTHSSTTTQSSDNIAFTWTLESDVTAHQGTVTFAIRMVKRNGTKIVKQFDTDKATGIVLDGMNVFQRIPLSDQKDILGKIETDAVENIQENLNNYTVEKKTELNVYTDDKKNIINEFTDSCKSAITALTSEETKAITDLTTESKNEIDKTKTAALNDLSWKEPVDKNTAAIASLKEDLYNLPNYNFDKNYAYGIQSNNNFTNGGNNLNVISSIILPIDKYYIFAKIKIATQITDTYVRLYVQQANFNSDFVKVDGSGEYFLEGHFSIENQADSYSSVRVDFNQNDPSRSVDVESLFIVKDSNRIISAIKNNTIDRENVCSFVLEKEYYPVNMATKEDIDTLKKEFLAEPEPLFDFVKDYGNRNYSICLIGDSTSDGKAGPAIGIYTALSQQQKSGELLDGVQVIDRGSNGSTAEAYIGSYSSNSGSLYNAIQDNADIYVVCLGINDVRQGLCTKETLKERISFIVNEILSKTKGRVILRTPNSLGNDDVSEQYIKPYTSAQKYTDILWEAYDELKNVWSCTRVRSLDMQTLIFGRKSVPSATNFLMGDVLHPSSNQSVTIMKDHWNYGMNIIGLCIARAIGYKEKPNAFEIFKAKTNNPTNPYIEYPLILESKDYATKKIYELNQGDVKASYIQFFDAQKETTILKTGDILRFGNEFCKVYNGERTQNIGTLLHVEMAFSESELEKAKNVFTVSVYRL